MAPIKDGHYWVKMKQPLNKGIWQPIYFWDENYINIVGCTISYSKADIEEWGPELIPPPVKS